MSLRSKILLILAVVVGVFSVGDNLIQRRMVGQSFEDLEKREAAQDLERVVHALEAERGALELRARDWAATREVRRACIDSEIHGLADLLDGSSLVDRELDLIYACDTAGKVLWGHVEDPSSGEAISLREMPAGQLAAQHPLIKRAANQDSVGGLLMTEHGAMLLGSHVVRDPADGSTAGTLILGRFIDRGLLDALGEREQVTFSVWPLDEAQLPPDRPGLIDEITTASGHVVDRDADGMLHLYATVPDLLDRPSILVRADIEPEITRRGARSVSYALLSTVGTGLLIMFVLVRLLTRIVIGPLSKLTRAATQIGATDDTSLRTGIRREDEIGQLSTEFDSMLEKLETSKHEVIRTSRLAGMSEIATGVLHNVGNVLNSVNVSANLVTRKVEGLPVDDLRAMRDVLREHEGNLGEFVEGDPQGRHLLPFLDELVGALSEGKRTALAELGGMNQGVEHIGELVRSQQSLAGRHGVLEPTDLAELIDAAVVICQQAGKGKNVRIAREYEEIGRVEADRHKLMEVLVNLIKNAFDAMDRPEISKKRMTLSLERTGPARVRIRVRDTGQGIAKTDLARVFQHGFTKKEGGHGFGLHVSANAATEMCGSLIAESEGIGQGATFVLELPAEEAPVAHAA